MSHKITTNWKGNMLFDSDNPSGHHVLMDTDVEGKAREGLSPKALMLSSLAGCSGLDVVSILDKMKINSYDLKMEVEGLLTDEHPKYYHTVILDYHFTGDDLNEEKINRAVQLSVEKYCGVMEMFRRFAEVKTNVHFHNK
ncbi:MULTISPECIES: OsmC family protein [Flavobacteriaceae]|uniref:OsmC family protein n=1 Tax=Flavobacteriaceae TaxID=49546 RepID=UPI000C30F3D2|nr:MULTISPECIES: OsmC family protein [Flavobacteriaceae]AUC74589.1 osmotically inducible protein OsmC [Olleya sp. Bg11-27]QCE41291.1 OsmC family protein [Psychroserpens sp. NJDZ02]